DAKALNREDAAALCGIHGYTEAGAALTQALDDKEWPVVLAASISIGKIRHKEARSKLEALLHDRDWKKRGGAAIALAWFRDAEATEVLIEALMDDDVCVKATIQHALERITGRKDAPSRNRWSAWWKKNKENFEFIDLPADERKARDAGYASGGYGMFKDLDITVLDTREGGDNIEELLERLSIEHRLTIVGQVTNAALHPFGMFVANCPGEITNDDADRVNWFVRSGGYMFASCWALTHTVAKAFPGIAQQYPTPEQVMDVVDAEPVPRSPRFLGGVFREGTATRYVLEGSHLIQTLDPDRFEVLVDSVPSASRWGEGDLAGWFTVGHGLVLDSANHFDLQGMKRDVPKKADGRKALAMDVLGYSYAEVREIEKKGIFRSATKSTKELEDLSMFRLITNFVRQKRFSEL
ncbi:MAG: HEAT repeat domain-containing protein, partial [Planctomycetes bacterium]|nr:HEAT repeat domain-containing protein [Planctomycetota bacterium]